MKVGTVVRTPLILVQGHLKILSGERNVSVQVHSAPILQQTETRGRRNSYRDSITIQHSSATVATKLTSQDEKADRSK